MDVAIVPRVEIELHTGSSLNKTPASGVTGMKKLFIFKLNIKEPRQMQEEKSVLKIFVGTTPGSKKTRDN